MSRRARSALTLIPTLAALICGGVWQARAQTQPIEVQQSPSTTNLLQGLLSGLTPTTTTTPASQPGAPSGPAQEEVADSGSAAVEPASGDDAEDTTERTIPPEAQRIINSVLRTGSNNSLGLLEALRRLTDAGMTEEEAALIGFRQFPVAGEAWWSDDWYEARFTPEFHFHEGTDIFAARGTPVRAPVDGLLELSNGGAGGLGATVTGSDGTYYYMCHLDDFGDFSSGSYVKQGDVVGFVGDSGNAVGGAPHVHFEVHPGGGGPINPKPILDQWIEEAILNVPAILAPFQVGLPRPLTAAGMLRRLDAGSLGPPMSSDGPQLWATSLRKHNGAIRLSDLAEEHAPWDPRVRGAAAREADWRRADQMARDVLAPLTPRVLNGVLTGGS